MTADTISKMPAPCGSWKSPVTVETMTRATAGFSSPWIDGNAVYWCESRPWEKGRTVLMRWTEAQGLQDLSAEGHDIRSRVHEYGGRAYTVYRGTVWYLNATDQKIYRVEPGERPSALPIKDPINVADLVVDPARDRLIAVTERPGAREEASGENENLLIAIGFDGAVSELAQGADFYCAPKLSPDGARLAWMEWDHPNMPWDESRIMEACLDGKGLPEGPAQIIAGDPGASVFQPEYAPDGTLYHVSDKGGFWNLCRAGSTPGETSTNSPANTAINTPAHFKASVEFGLPHWQFGMRTYGFLDSHTALTAFAVEGEWRLGLFDLESGRITPLDLPWCRFDGLVCRDREVVFIGAREDGPGGVVRLTLGAPQPEKVLKLSTETLPDPEDVSIPKRIEVPTENGKTAFAYYYAPANARFSVPEEERPPLIVMGHGGPTGQTDRGYNPKVQFWTSRGFAVADVNYGGSTGYGRAYRERLEGNWGVVDVDDCCNVAKYLVARGDVDPDRLIIVGGSAGGYTTLSALAFRNVFRAGRSSYGIGDLETLARDTHKFESRYLDSLIGKWPEDQALYDQRSPLKNPQGLDCPVLFLQGAEDKVVPPNQAEAMVRVLQEKGVPVACLLFEGEGHGFRSAATLKAAYLAELTFYGKVFGFTPAEGFTDLEIANL